MHNAIVTTEFIYNTLKEFSLEPVARPLSFICFLLLYMNEEECKKLLCNINPVARENA